jgi:hypothetical protein
MEVTLELLTNGFITTILPIKHAHPIRLMDMITDWDVQLKLSAKTVFLTKDAGLNKELKSTVLINSEMLSEKKT